MHYTSGLSYHGQVICIYSLDASCGVSCSPYLVLECICVMNDLHQMLGTPFVLSGQQSWTGGWWKPTPLLDPQNTNTGFCTLWLFPPSNMPLTTDPQCLIPSWIHTGSISCGSMIDSSLSIGSVSGLSQGHWSKEFSNGVETLRVFLKQRHKRCILLLLSSGTCPVLRTSCTNYGTNASPPFFRSSAVMLSFPADFTN